MGRDTSILFLNQYLPFTFLPSYNLTRKDLGRFGQKYFKTYIVNLLQSSAVLIFVLKQRECPGGKFKNRCTRYLGGKDSMCKWCCRPE